MKHLHMTFAIVFLLSYLIKTILFFTNKEGFRSYKAKTLIPETLASVGFLATGIYMAFFTIGMASLPGWFHLKLTLVILGIPLGIVGFKKENKVLVFLSALFFSYVLALAFIKNPLLFF
jgi:uncharacterized membrane protein SirB2